jgi:predicted nuclease of restriction endonuclease-like RecB superfamily
MLKSDLLIYKRNGETVVPKKLGIDNQNLAIATELIDCFQGCVGQTQGELDRQLLKFEGNSPDYRIKRGLAHILRNTFSTFEIVSPLEPFTLRQKVFSQAAKTITQPAKRSETLEVISHALTQELKRQVSSHEIEAGLYADLQENRILTQFEAPIPESLIHRYNLSQVQGIFYRASNVVINAHRNDPGEYKLLFRYLKLFQLMAYIEGDADTGFTLTMDGPASLFKASTRYGLALAKMIPALLHVTKWSLQAKLQNRDQYSGNVKTGKFSLTSDRCDLVSHYPPGKPYDSMLEASFVNSWNKAKTEWQLEREVDLIPLPGSVMIPDFRLVHPDGREFLLEIVGYWRPKYLQKKFYQVRNGNTDNLIIAVSQRLNLEKAGVKFNDLPNKLIWFKNKLNAKAVLEILDN